MENSTAAISPIDAQLILNEIRELRTIVEYLRPEADRFVTINFIAQHLGINRKTIHTMCVDGRLKGATQPGGKAGAEWRIPYPEYERLKKAKPAQRLKIVRL